MRCFRTPPPVPPTRKTKHSPTRREVFIHHRLCNQCLGRGAGCLLMPLPPQQREKKKAGARQSRGVTSSSSRVGGPLATPTPTTAAAAAAAATRQRNAKRTLPVPLSWAASNITPGHSSENQRCTQKPIYTPITTHNIKSRLRRVCTPEMV